MADEEKLKPAAANGNYLFISRCLLRLRLLLMLMLLRLPAAAAAESDFVFSFGHLPWLCVWI